MQATLLAVLAMIEQILQTTTQAGTVASVVETIIDTLTKLMPYIEGEIAALYTPVKAIIALLQNSGAVTADQAAALQQLDAQVDTAFEAIAVQEDPDAPTQTAS